MRPSFSGTIFATTRSPPKPNTVPQGVKIIEGIDVGEEGAGKKIVEGLKGEKVGLVVIVSGVLKPEVSTSDARGVWESRADGLVRADSRGAQVGGRT